MSDEVTHIHRKLSLDPERVEYKGIPIMIHHRSKTNDYVWTFTIVKTTKHAGKAIQHAAALRHAKRRVDIVTQYTQPDGS